jgi:hypothetical protein
VEELRRLLRYVSPVVVLLLEATVLVLIWEPGFIQTIQHFVGRLDDSSGIALVAVGLVGSGAVGFALSTVHHMAMWRCRPWGYDHTTFVNDVEHDFDITCICPKSVATCTPKRFADRLRSKSEQVVSIRKAGALWYEFKANDAGFEMAESKMKALSDLTHGLGTTTIATAAAPIAALLFLYFFEASPVPSNHVVVSYPTIWFAVISMGTLLLFLEGYLRTKDSTADLFERLIWAALRKHGTIKPIPPETRGSTGDAADPNA